MSKEGDFLLIEKRSYRTSLAKTEKQKQWYTKREPEDMQRLYPRGNRILIRPLETFARVAGSECNE